MARVWQISQPSVPSPCNLIASMPMVTTASSGPGLGEAQFIGLESAESVPLGAAIKTVSCSVSNDDLSQVAQAVWPLMRHLALTFRKSGCDSVRASATGFSMLAGAVWPRPLLERLRLLLYGRCWIFYGNQPFLVLMHHDACFMQSQHLHVLACLGHRALGC